jgi:hypothetical protein
MFDEKSFIAFYLGYLLTLILVVICSIAGLVEKDKTTGKTIIPASHSRSFVIACSINGFAFIVACNTLMMMLFGAHPFGVIFMLGLMFCVICSFVLILIVLTRLIYNFYNRNTPQSWRLFLYQVLTLVHCLFACPVSVMFIPIE